MLIKQPLVIRDVQEELDEPYTLGIRESKSEHSWSLLFISADSEDADVQSGLIGYCLVVHPTQATCYGGVASYEVDEDALTLRMSNEAATILDLSPVTTFQLEVPEVQRDILIRGLQRLLDDESGASL